MTHQHSVSQSQVDILLPHLPLGKIVHDKSFFASILPNEIVCDSGEGFYSVLCIYPNGRTVRDFYTKYKTMKMLLGDKLLPVFYLVENGAIVSYFVVYIRK